MAVKALTALITVIAGVGVALIVYWLLNKLAELLPGSWEDRIKPYLYILPAYAAVTIYLIYPAVQTFVNSFKDRASTEWVGLQNYTDLLTSDSFKDTLFNTLLWIIIVPAVTVIGYSLGGLLGGATGAVTSCVPAEAVGVTPMESSL